MRGRGGITPVPDSMTIEKGTSIVGSEWGRPVDVTTEPVTLNPKGAPGKGVRYHDPWGHNVESEGVIAYKHSRGAGALTPKTDDYRLVDPRAEEREKHEAAIMEATARRTEELMVDMEGDVSKRRGPGGEQGARAGSSGVLGGYLYEVKPPKVTLPPTDPNSVAAALVRDR